MFGVFSKLSLVFSLGLFASFAHGQDLIGDDLQTGSLGPLKLEQTDPILASKPVIVIDPGHGGIDPGAISHDGLLEKDVVLSFADALALSLKMSGKFDVHLTRASDKFVGLEWRADFARKAKASLFISIHADSLKDPAMRGLTIYGHSETASDPHAAKLAQVENQVDHLAGVELSDQTPAIADALVALAARESRFEAGRFAKQALHNIKSVAFLSSHPMRSARFVVLKSPDVPSVLIELGYLSNKKDVAQLKSVKWRDEVVANLTKALSGHFVETLSAEN